jgi:5-amino-6-(5-phospho-D-ribitylamino)uracil phosphatase
VISLLDRRSRRLKRLKRIRCIACDLDGTLLRSDNELSADVRSAAHDAMRAGVRIVLASGRTDSFTRYYADQLGIDTPVISLNGSLVRHGEQGALSASSLPEKLRGEIETLQQLGTAPASVALFTESGIFVEDEHAAIPRYLHTRHDEVFRITSLSAMYSRAVLIVISGGYNAVQRYSIAISRRFGRKLQRTMYQSGSGHDLFYLEIRNARTNKATGLAFVLNLLGIHPSHCASIGDYTNDLEMCKFTGVSAAMRNGCEELKSVADVVTLRSNDEDGVAEFLRFILAQRERT